MRRPRLEARLRAGLGSRLTLVAAPAGSGKSTLLSTWLGRLDRPAAWLSLDAGDNDPRRFLSYLVGALQRLEPGLGAGLQETLQQQVTVQGEPVVMRLINDVMRWDRPVVLVLDDYHLISNEQVHSALEFLLDHLPPQLCLVIATRRDPPLALARLRVRGQLTEVRERDLRFNRREAESFLNDRSGLGLSGEAIDNLEARTEGWAAGLQLAALSLTGRPGKEALVTQFTGSHRYLIDYLMDEVLAKQSEDVRRFLQRTALLDRFTASLCESVSGQPHSQGVLEGLSAANLFLIPLDDQGEWYRYHHLFAEFLRHRFREAEGDRLPELYGRASRWFEGRGLTDEAYRYAVLAGDMGRAAGLVQAVASDLVIQGRAPQLLKYAEGLPAPLLPDYPVLCFYVSCALSDTGQFERLPALVQLLGARPDSVLAAAGRSLFSGILCLHRLEFGEAGAFAEAAVALLEPHVAAFGGRDEGLLLASSTSLRTLAALLDGRLAEAERAYPVVLERSQRAGNHLAAMSCFARWGRVKHLQGQLHGAMDLYRRGLGALQVWAGRAPSDGVATTQDELCLNLAALHYEWGALDEAEGYLERAHTFNERSQYPPALAQEVELTFCLRLAKGYPVAEDLIAQLDRLSGSLGPDNRLDRLVFAPGPLAELRGRVERLGLGPRDAFSYPYEGAYFILAGLDTLAGSAGEALDLLTRLARAAEAGGRTDDLIRYRIAQVLAYERLGRRPEAARELRAVLELAEPQGYLRSFIDAGKPMQTLLRAVAEGGAQAAYARRLLASFPAADTERLGPPEEVQRAEPDWLEPLSERERDVLRLLGAGNANKQIAKALGLSPNTVRWYVSSLLSKLHVSSRLEAVSRAQALGLI